MDFWFPIISGVLCIKYLLKVFEKGEEGEDDWYS